MVIVSFIISSIVIIDPNEKSNVIIPAKETVIWKTFGLGYNFVSKWPYIIITKPSTCKYGIEHNWSYEIYSSKPVQIPVGYVGVMHPINNYNIEDSKVLTPGMYQINLALFKVTLVSTRKHEYIFKGKPE